MSFTSDNWSQLIALGVIWVPLIIFFIYKLMVETCRETTLPITLQQKGISMKDSDSNLNYPKYIITPIFRSPSNDYKMKSTDITLDILTENRSTYKMYKTVAIVVNSSKMEVNRDLVCLKEYRISFLLIRRNELPPITQIRTTHNGSKDSSIFLEGIETIDEMSGQQMFYAIKDYVIQSKSGKVLPVRPQTLSFCSKETFSPTFYCLSFETFGEYIDEQQNGIIIQPKLEWFEVLLMFGLLISLTFVGINVFVIQINELSTDKMLVIIGTLLSSSFIGFTITELMALFYRQIIKRKLNSECTPNKRSLGKASYLWPFIRFITLSLILVLSIGLSLSVCFMENTILKKYWDFGSVPELPVISIVVLALVSIVLLWLPFYSIIRFFKRSLCFKKRADIDLEKNLQSYQILSDTTDVSYFSTASDKKVERKDMGRNLDKQLKDDKEVKDQTKTKNSPKKTPQFVDYDSKGYKKGAKRLTFNTERLDQELADNEKLKRLITNSVITNATKSKGFENPEDFRLTHSKIAKQKKKKIKK